MKNYQENIRAKLDRVKTIEFSENATIVDMNIQEQKILNELNSEFEFARYDLQESDILRTLKIIEILDTYPEVFKYRSALKLFYVVTRVDIILAQTLQEYCDLSRVEFKTVTNAMIKHDLMHKHDNEELELTLNGKSLAVRIGTDIFI